MRAIFILLLAANLVFFGYQHFFSTENNAKRSLNGASKTSSSGDELQLLAERESVPASRPKIKREQAQGARASDNESRNQDFCTMIGPYGQLLQAEYAAERLIALGAAAHITPVEIKEGESYWVYLKPEVSEKEALRRLYELQKKNIESHVITKGELTNGISFGRFADYTDAEARSIEIKKHGYAIDIKMLPRMIQETWVVLEAGFAEKIDEAVWLDLLTKEAGLEKRQNFCLGVASQ